MAEITVCENHYRRRRLTRFRCVDGHGIVFDRHYCAECVDHELRGDEYEHFWREQDDGSYLGEKPRCTGPSEWCNGDDAYHAALAHA